MSQPKKIAVLGAGPSGLAAIKCCLDAGLVPVCFERNSQLGGLWLYHEEDLEGVPSVMRSTVINTSKEMSAFSDYPPPKDFPNYMHNSKMHLYFMRYARYFSLRPHIRYNLEVIWVEKTSDFDSTGRWTVSVRNTQTSEMTKEEFDGVMVCVGHHVYPKIAVFCGQDSFKGSVIHTHSLKNCDAYRGKKVVVVGIGNSGVDAAVECSHVADQVYLSTRRGSWIFGRVGENGRPFDITFTTRKNLLLSKMLSNDTVCDMIEEDLNRKFDHDAYRLRPAHRVLSAHPTLNDALPNCILSGRVIVKGDIEYFEEDGIVFAGENQKVTCVDAVIMATGYHMKFPFIHEGIVPTMDNQIHLYKYAIPPRLKHPTLAIIGAIQPIGAIFPISEMQCRWFIEIMNGNVKLPSVDEMQKDVDRKNKLNEQRYVESTRHTIQVDWIPFMDELASMIGAKPNLFKMVLTDPKLFWACFNGPCLPYQYRLQGPHPWPGARYAILNYEERFYAPLNTKVEVVCQKKKEFMNVKIPLLLLAFSAAYIAYHFKNYLGSVTSIIPPNFTQSFSIPPASP